MLIKINVDIESDDELLITINSTTKTLSKYLPSTTFEVEEGRHQMTVEQRRGYEPPKIVRWIFYIVTILFQGLFNILLINVDRQWWSKSCPYSIDVKYFLNIYSNMEIDIEFLCGMYENETWSFPEIKVSQDFESEKQFRYNPRVIDCAFYRYVRKVISVSLVALSLFGLLLCVAHSNHLLFAEIFLGILLLGIVLISGTLILQQWIKKNKLKKTLEF